MASSTHIRIAKNSIVLYIRMLITMGITIFTTRVVLEALGVIDYGIYNIVGGIISFISMVTGALTLSVQRYLNFELGKNDRNRVSEVFSAAILIHLGIALILYVALQTIGVYYFKVSLNIPAERFDAALEVFHLSTIAASLSIAMSPFGAVIISHERMDLYAYITIIEVILKLAVAYIVLTFNGDRLIIYGLLILGVNVFHSLLNITVWLHWFGYIKFRLKFNKKLFVQLTSFASWSAFGQLAWAFTIQGTNILLNIFFGNILNAAYGVSVQIQSAVNRFVQSFQTAINPQIIKKYAKKDIEDVKTLVFNGTKFSCFLFLLMAIPIFFELDLILDIWLTEVPSYTSIFCKIMLINILFDTLSNLFATLVQATGEIKKYQLVVSSILFLNFPLSYIGIKLTGLPYIIYIIYGFISICLVITRIRLISSKLKIKIWSSFLKIVLSPILKVLIIIVPIAFLLHELLSSLAPVIQILLFVGVSAFVTGVAILFIGLTRAERSKIINLVRSKLSHE